MPGKCPRDGLGANPGTSGTSRPDLCVIPRRLDRMSAGQSGHVHVMVVLLSRTVGVPLNLLIFVLFPILPCGRGVLFFRFFIKCQFRKFGDTIGETPREQSQCQAWVS